MASGKYVGGIRWDFWYTNTGSAYSTGRSLGNPPYQYRAPVHATVQSSNAIVYTCTQNIMDAEITAAKNGGLSYWAFLYYTSAEPSPVLAKSFYDSSSIKAQMPWCTIRDTTKWGTTANHSAQVNEVISQCLESNYFKVLGNRPLIYILYSATEVATFYTNNANFKIALDEVRAGVASGGGANPYIVILEGGASAASATATALGADAISNYITDVPETLNAPFSSLDTLQQAYWASLLGTGQKMIPIVMLGWDRAPRIDRPHPFQRTSQRPYFGASKIVVPATNSELIAGFQASINFINANPVACETNTVLFYAWNECDEGGWILPTIGDPTGARLAAIKSTIEF